jgi:hypothetical protein
MIRILLLTIFVLLQAGFADRCRAQNIIINNDLTFRDMLGGVPKVVSKHTAGSAAEFLVTGTAGAEVTVDITLPQYMYSSGYTLQLVFTDTDCAMDSSATPDQSNPGFNDRNPWETQTYRIGSNGLTIWLGALALPRTTQQPGDYTAPIVLTVTYTGN